MQNKTMLAFVWNTWFLCWPCWLYYYSHLNAHLQNGNNVYLSLDLRNGFFFKCRILLFLCYLMLFRTQERQSLTNFKCWQFSNYKTVQLEAQSAVFPEAFISHIQIHPGFPSVLQNAHLVWLLRSSQWGFLIKDSKTKRMKRTHGVQIPLLKGGERCSFY